MDTDFLASGGKPKMLKRRHLTIRLPVFVVFSGMALAALPRPLRADSEIVPAHAESAQAPSRSTFSDFLQTGARLFGKSSRPGSNANSRGYPDVDAKGTSSSAARKEAIAALPVE